MHKQTHMSPLKDVSEPQFHLHREKYFPITSLRNSTQVAHFRSSKSSTHTTAVIAPPRIVRQSPSPSLGIIAVLPLFFLTPTFTRNNNSYTAHSLVYINCVRKQNPVRWADSFLTRPSAHWLETSPTPSSLLSTDIATASGSFLPLAFSRLPSLCPFLPGVSQRRRYRSYWEPPGCWGGREDAASRAWGAPWYLKWGW